MKLGFGYGKSENEVSFGVATRNGELSRSDPETPEPRTDLILKLTAKFGVGKTKVGDTMRI